MHRVGQIPVATVIDDLLDEVELRERSICEFCFQVHVASLLVLTPGMQGHVAYPILQLDAPIMKSNIRSHSLPMNDERIYVHWQICEEAGVGMATMPVHTRCFKQGTMCVIPASKMNPNSVTSTSQSKSNKKQPRLTRSHSCGPQMTRSHNKARTVDAMQHSANTPTLVAELQSVGLELDQFVLEPAKGSPKMKSRPSTRQPSSSAQPASTPQPASTSQPPSTSQPWPSSTS